MTRIGRLAGTTLLLVGLAAAASACTTAPALQAEPAARQQGSAATWTLADPGGIDAESTTLELVVTRLECSGGKTGDLLDPWVVYEEERVIVQVDAVPLTGDAYDCQGNDAVNVTVQLDEPLGTRPLVDGACLEEPAMSTVFCVGGAVRHDAP